MVIAAIIIGIILVFFVCLTFYISDRKDSSFEDGVTLGIIITMLLCIETILIGGIRGESIPTAMDVYQGNTELEIISVNGVPTDTVVVFKNK